MEQEGQDGPRSLTCEMSLPSGMIWTIFVTYQISKLRALWLMINKVFQALTWSMFFNGPKPLLNSTNISLRQTFWQSYMKIGHEMWLLQCLQVFSYFFDLVTLFLTQHDPVSNSIKVSLGQMFWPSFMKIGQEMWPLECLQGFSKAKEGKLPCPLAAMFFNGPEPFLNSTNISFRQTFWQSYRKIGHQMWLLQCSQGFSFFWPSDLLLTQHDPVLNSIEV